MSVRDWLGTIGLKNEALQYGELLKEQKYLNLSDLLGDPPSKDDLKEYGITAGRDINRILNRLKDAGGTGMELFCSMSPMSPM